jgi:predicted DNA-binding protein (UPF0251 family)
MLAQFCIPGLKILLSILDFFISLSTARKKVSDALTNGKAIKIENSDDKID